VPPETALASREDARARAARNRSRTGIAADDGFPRARNPFGPSEIIGPVARINLLTWTDGKVPFALGHKMWIENGLVVLRSNKGSMSWHDASEIVSISPASEFWSDMFKDEPDDPPTLRVVE
jgi:hypothetical protein